MIDWLLAGDVAVAHQTRRDLLGVDDPGLQGRIAHEGDGARLLAARRPDGHWGRGFYQPKWTSSHYTLLELRDLGLPRDHPQARESVALILATYRAEDGGLDPRPGIRSSDACINGMALNYSSWFGAPEHDLRSIVDRLLAGLVPDGGFNCEHRPGHEVRHSSMHTTVSVLEGIEAYRAAGHGHRLAELERAVDSAVEFLLRHELFRSERTGAVIRPDFTRLHHPPRWHFDILRGLDCLATLGRPHDSRMDAALDVLRSRRRADGRWSARSWPGETHVPRPSGREPSPWATLRALRVLHHFGVPDEAAGSTLDDVGTP